MTTNSKTEPQSELEKLIAQISKEQETVATQIYGEAVARLGRKVTTMGLPSLLVWLVEVYLYFMDRCGVPETYSDLLEMIKFVESQSTQKIKEGAGIQ